MECIGDPATVVADFETAISAFAKPEIDMSDVMLSMTKIGMSVKKLAEAAKKCDNKMTEKEL